MHEASLVQGLLSLALESRENYNKSNPGKAAGVIKEIKCGFGLLACFEPEALRLCFELFAEGTAAEKAELILEPEPLPCHCRRCGADFELMEKRFICPRCESADISFEGGGGLTLQSIDVESEEA